MTFVVHNTTTSFLTTLISLHILLYIFPFHTHVFNQLLKMKCFGGMYLPELSHNGGKIDARSTETNPSTDCVITNPYLFIYFFILVVYSFTTFAEYGTQREHKQ